MMKHTAVRDYHNHLKMLHRLMRMLLLILTTKSINHVILRQVGLYFIILVNSEQFVPCESEISEKKFHLSKPTHT